MVSELELRLLDDSGVTRQLFRRIVDADTDEISLPAHEIIEPVPGCHVTLYDGGGEGVHILYFPAEYDNEVTTGLAASCFTDFGMTFMAFHYANGVDQDVRLSNLFEEGNGFVEAAIKFMEENGRTGNLVIMGRSLGSGVALNAAVRFQDRILCLVIESGFDRFGDFLSGKGVDASLFVSVGDPFNNRNRMKEFEKPVMFIHSHRDEVVSLEQVEWLVAESRSMATQFQIAPSGTREELAMQAPDIYAEQLKDYINIRQGIRPKSRRRSKRRHRAASSIEGFVQIERLFD